MCVCVSRGLHGLLSCRELLLNRQRVAQPARQPVVRQVPAPCCYLCLSEAAPRASLPPFSLLPTDSSNLFPWQESCLTAAYRSWNEKPATEASAPFTAIVSLKQGAGPRQSAKRGVAGVPRWPCCGCCCCWAPVTCCCLLLCVSPQLRGRASRGAEGGGGPGTAFVSVPRPMPHSWN